MARQLPDWIATVVIVAGLLIVPARVSAAENFAELIGQSDQNAAVITHYGYVTHAKGLNDAALFFDPLVRTEATAKYTFYATTVLNARHVHGNIITTASSPGQFIVYERASGGADFNDPDSFRVGTAILSFAVRYFNVLNVQGQNQQGQSTGIASATAVLGDGYGLRLRLTATGQGTLLVNDPPTVVSTILLGGFVVEEP